MLPLVELYTSEGCSSCPPADRWLAAQAGRNDATWLAFHVDYWDSLGWRDRFASADYSARQRRRVQASGGDIVYTPQVMIGADVRVAWQSAGRFEQALHDARADAGGRLQLQWSGLQARLEVSGFDDADTAPRVWLARFRDGQTTEVGRGENRGATLRHERVVTDLWGPWPIADGSLSHVIGMAAVAGSWGLVAFVQDSKGRILQSLALPAASCSPAAAR
ncbi:MAG TPA: DUF1223 domain-containing protein [Dokdonella sp.]|nr:DUF1223 domain-containing protein [Dokdonella sp.]